MKKIKKVLGSLLIVSALPLLSHCGDDSVADMNARQRDREHELQNYETQVNGSVAGTYKAYSTPNSAPSTSDMILTLKGTCKVTDPSVTLTNVPTAYLCGQLIIVPKIKMTAKSQPLIISYPIENGIYDGSTLSFKVEQNGPGASNVSCQYKSNEFICDWYTSSPNASGIHFKRVSNTILASLSTRAISDQVYSGHNEDFNILVQFNSGLTTPAGQQQPIPTILGEIVFFDRSSKRLSPGPDDTKVPYSIQSGSFDPFGNTITLVIGNSGAMQMNCKVFNAGKRLECTFNSRVYQDFTLNQTTRR
jgi:hypothetical protein